MIRILDQQRATSPACFPSGSKFAKVYPEKLQHAKNTNRSSSVPRRSENEIISTHQTKQNYRVLRACQPCKVLVCPASSSCKRRVLQSSKRQRKHQNRQPLLFSIPRGKNISEKQFLAKLSSTWACQSVRSLVRSPGVLSKLLATAEGLTKLQKAQKAPKQTTFIIFHQRGKIFQKSVFGQTVEYFEPVGQFDAL